jgi:hypothetical protein
MYVGLEFQKKKYMGLERMLTGLPLSLPRKENRSMDNGFGENQQRGGIM